MNAFARDAGTASPIALHSARKTRLKPIAHLPAAELPLLRRHLLTWYRANKRDLDWRRSSDPYHIWLSEIMLQQTRVAAVIPYYQRFLERFPTVRHLARARQDAVLRRWAGLGYYSRARNLHRAAQQIAANHGAKFPRTLEEALALPGVGHYTASAVLSIAYQKPLAVLDGNVARVLARWSALAGDLRRPQTWRGLQATADRMLSTSAPGDWNQAMMELGATVCTPRAPRCTECPVRRWCRADALGLAARLPTARRKPATVRMTLAAAVLLDPQGRTLLVRHKNSDGAFFSRLWQFPAVELSRNEISPNGSSNGDGNAAGSALSQHLARTLDLHGVTLQPLPTAKHAVTFHNIRLAPYLARVERLPQAPRARPTDGARQAADMRLTPLTDLDRLPVSGATRKIARAALAAV